MRSLLLVIALSFFSFAYADKKDNYSFYFTGLLYHFDTAPENNDANMDYFAFSKDFRKGNWLFENGAGTYLDTYYKRSYLVFSNITHDRFRKEWYSLMLSLNCTYKGKELDSNKRETICGPLAKLSIGKRKGLFSNVTLMPKHEDLTNGFVGIEFGYKF